MGCDGGTIPKRDELVRQKKKAEVKDKNAANMAKWRHCALKHDPLQQPIVVDSYGLLYNKDAILEYLLDRTKFEHGPTYIKKLKDIKEIQLKENQSFKPNNNDLGTEYLDVYSSPFICPISFVEMNGKYKFCAIWTCGCVISDRALRSLNQNNNTEEKLSCPNCGKEYSANNDMIILNPEEDDDINFMEQRRERLATSQKKNGSNKRKLPETEEETNGKKTKTESTAASSSSTITKASTSKSVSTTKPTNTKSSIQQDPTTSDLYKSLFTTSEAAKKKEKNKAHWVTYNPLYF